MKLSYRFVLITLLAVALVGGTRWALAQDDNIMLACAAKDGTLRLVGDWSDCKDKETPVRWNIAGIPGPKGEKGDPGEPGLPGPPGTTDWYGLTNVPSDIADGDDNTLGSLSCTTDQIAKFDGSQWVCADNNVAELEARIAALEDLLIHFSRDGNEVFISGANLNVVNGTGHTHTTNGLGNVIIGYNDVDPGGFPDCVVGDRSGSHNLVVGSLHTYSSYGGLLSGTCNTASGSSASVTGGANNTASAFASSVSGGNGNIANEEYASVSGGAGNIANSHASSICGGIDNSALGWFSSVSGGSENTASGFTSSISGGWQNSAVGKWSAVSGGQENTASDLASISGGHSNIASGGNSWIGGGHGNIASGEASSVSGGWSNTASGFRSSVSGGYNRSVSGDNDWAAGSLFEDQ